MRLAKIIERILSNPLVYALNSAMVNRYKVAAVKKIREDFSGLRVLDIGCGPGTNAPLFRGAEYTGIDINEKYIAVARKKFPRATFIVGDAEEIEWKGRFDIVLLNSSLHHINDAKVRTILKKAVTSLGDEGRVIVQEPLTPEKGEWYHQLLMRLDRGNYFRSLGHWKRLVEDSGLAIEDIGFYELKVLEVKGYHMVSLFLKRP